MAGTPTIGFIGLGIMGTPAAKNLVDAGYDLVVHDVREERVEELESYGTDSAPTPAEVAAASDVVITFLPEGKHVREVALGEDGLAEGVDDGPAEDVEEGLAEGADEGLVYVDMSTIGPATIREVAEELSPLGVHVIDAPVSGSERGSKAGTLRLMVGSDEPIPEAVSAIFDVVGGQVVHIGDLGAGQVAKICNNMVGAASTVALSEALVFAEKAGVDKERLVEGMKGATGQTWVLDNRAEEMIAGDFEPGFFGSYHYKDLRIGINDAQEFGVPVPLSSVNHELYKTLEQKGRGHLDTSAVVTVLEDMAGLEHDV